MSTSKHPDFVESGPDADMSAIDGLCVDIGEIHFCSASKVLCGLGSHQGEMPMVLLAMDRGPRGLHIRLTPKGARQLAATMLSAAGDAEAKGAADTAARLSTLTGKPVAVADPHHEDLNRRIRAAREECPDDPAYTEDYPGSDWPDAPYPAPHPAPDDIDDIDDWRERMADRIAMAAVAGVALLGLAAWLA